MPQLVAGPGRGAPAGRGMGLSAPPGAISSRPMNYPMGGPPGGFGRPPPGMMGAPPGMPGGPPPGFAGGFARPPPFGFPPRPPQ